MALRVGNGAVQWLIGDQLGSTSVTAEAAGSRTGELWYKPYGASSSGWGVTPTQHRFTGQILDEVGGGLYYYGARYYDPYLNRWIQPDIIVPDPANPQSLNRYSFASNNPLRYVDKNGHCGPLTPLCIALLLGGMALTIKVENFDYQFTPEDINSQKLGVALMVAAGSGAVGGQILGASSAAAEVGTAAATAACADGDCTNEAKAVGSAAQAAANASQAASNPAALRQAYETAVRGLADRANQLRALGKSAEEIARDLHAERRALGTQYKDMTPPDLLEKIYERNLERYGDKLGPTIEYLLAHGKSWEDIIESASRPGGQDIIPKLLGQ